VFGSTALIISPESLLAERAVAERVAEAQSENPAAELNNLDAADLEGGKFAEAVGGSLFSPTAIVVLRELERVSADQTDLIVRTAANPGPNLALVLVHNGGKQGRGILDKLARATVPKTQIPPVTPWELPKFVIAEARSRQVRMDGPAASALVEAVGTDLRALSGAVAQLSDDWQGKQLTAAMIGQYFAGRAEVTSFAVADDVMKGHSNAALAKLRWAMSTGVASVLIISALASALRNLGKYLDLRGSRMPQPELAKQVGVPPWKLKDLAAQSRDWTSAGVAAGITAVARADAAVKGGSADASFAMEQLLLNLDQARTNG
jgi:DNA polymerase-3 subunit delta